MFIRKKSFKRRVKDSILFCSFILLCILIVYIVLDSKVSRDYVVADSQIQLNVAYKENFYKLLTNIENGTTTGITEYDDSGVMYGERIEVAKGTGGFKNILPTYNTSKKTVTRINAWSDSKKPINWSTSTLAYELAYSKLLLKNYTVYDRSGAIKLFDRYNLAALGTYWSELFKVPLDRGMTYRVFLDNGKTFDILCMDTAMTDDDNSINATNGKSLGHIYPDGNTKNVVITELDVLDLQYNYPILKKQGTKWPEVRYEELVTKKNDSTHIWSQDMNVIPEYQGNVIALQVIDDPKVKEILALASEEVKMYKK